MSGTELLDVFVAWARRTAERIRSERINAEVEICPPSPNPGANLHIDSNEIMARITYWADGSYHAEALDSATAASTFTRHGNVLEAAEAEFEDFLDHIRARVSDG